MISTEGLSLALQYFSFANLQESISMKKNILDVTVGELIEHCSGMPCPGCPLEGIGDVSDCLMESGCQVGKLVSAWEYANLENIFIDTWDQMP